MQPKTKIAALDPICNYFNAIRLIAALQVLYVHVAVNLALPNVPFLRFAEQFPGVPVFFAVSGFLILDSFMRSRSIFDYLTARALRIYPALILNIGVLEIVFAAAGGASFRGAPWRQIAGYETIFALTASDAMGLLLSGLRGGGLAEIFLFNFRRECFGL